MSTTFPTSKQSITNASGTDKLNSPDHATQHATLNDTVEAMEDKIGMNSSAVATSHDYMLNNAAGRFKAHDHSGDDGENSDLLPSTLRIPSNVFIRSRNNADDGDINLIKADTSDTITIGTNNSGDHTIINAGTSKLVKIKVLRQDNTTNTYTENTVILTGWGHILGDGDSTTGTDTVSFGITFSEKPVVVTGNLGFKLLSDPSDIGDFTQLSRFNASGSIITTSQFTIDITDVSAAVILATTRCGYSWVAFGQLN